MGLSGRGGSFAASGVMAIIALELSCGVGGALVAIVALAVGAKVSLVCCGPGELISLALATRDCLDLLPPLGDASFPFVLVGFRLFFVIVTMVTLIASVCRWT